GVWSGPLRSHRHRLGRRAGAGCPRHRAIGARCRRHGHDDGRHAMKSIKSAERALRRYVIHAISRLMHRRAAPEARFPRWHERPHRVLFLRYDRIGDMIVSTGLIRAIATSHATIALDVLASRENAPVVSEEPHVRRVLVFERWKPWTYPALVR